MRGLRDRLTYANVVSTAALLIALSMGTGALALAGRNTVFSDDIAPEEVGTSDLADGAVTTAKFRPTAVAPNAGKLDGIDSTGFQRAGAAAGGDLAGTYPNPTIAPASIGSGKVVDDSLTGADIDETTLSGVTPNGAAGGDLAGTYPNPTIAPDTIGSGKVANNSLTGADIDETTLSGVTPNGAAGGDLAGTYPNPTIAPDSIGSGKVADSSLTGADVANQSLGGLDVAPDSLTGAHIAGGSLSGTDVSDNSLTFADIGDGAILSGEISDSAIASIDVGFDALTGADINESTLSGVTPAGAAGGDLAGSYPNPTVAANAIGSGKVADGSLTGADVADNTINGIDVGDNTLAGDDISDGSLSGNDVANDSLTGVDINEATLSGVTPNGAAGGDLTGFYPNPFIAANAIDTGNVAEGSLNGTDIANGALTGDDVSDNTLTGADILESSLSGVTPGGNAGGALSGTYPNPTLAGGVVAPAQFAVNSIPSAQGWAFNNTTITGDAAFVVLPLPFDQFDTMNMHSTSAATERVVAPIAGVYFVSAEVRWSGGTITDNAHHALRVHALGPRIDNPFVVSDVSAQIQDFNFGNVQNAAGLVQLNAGDYVQLEAAHTVSVPQGARGRLSLQWVAPITPY